MPALRHCDPYPIHDTTVKGRVHVSDSFLEQLRVPVQRAQVDLHTERGHRIAVIFLPPDCAPEDVFEAEPPFFPAEEGGIVRIFARAAVVSLVLDAGDAPPESLVSAGVVYATRPIAVYLRNGKVVTGVLTSLPGFSRTLDLLNQPPKSFAVRSGGKIHHIAKAHVERIEEL